MFKVEVVMDMKLPWFQEIIKKDGLYGRHCIQDSHFVYRCTVENGNSLWLDTSIEQVHLQIFPIDKSFKERFADKAGEKWSPTIKLNTTETETGFDEDGNPNHSRANNFKGDTDES